MFDFNLSMWELIQDLTQSMPDFRHVNPQRLRVSVSYNHKRRRSGLLAYLLPLRFKDGCPVERKKRSGKLYHYAMHPLKDREEEILYIVYFVLPRFMNLSFKDKLETIVHELYHIHPDFNGDFRRFPGRKCIHGHSLKQFDRIVRQMTQTFLSEHSHRIENYSFLRWNFAESQKNLGPLKAFRIPEPKPKLIHVETVN